jgi:tRNA nucleotidyltransferase (CCA-adding enzyme)
MPNPTRRVSLNTTVAKALRILEYHGELELSVGELGDLLLRRDLELAQYHGCGGDRVANFMATVPKQTRAATDAEKSRLQTQMQKLLLPRYRDILTRASELADRLNLQLYLVGGTVRDYLLNLATDDLDLVVDGDRSLVQNGIELEGLGIKLARSLQAVYPTAKLEIHAKFQTAAITWADGVWIDIATARSEFYPYVGALPEVTASSIQQDLYRRDFSINALALRLNGSRQGEILDFFGGLADLEHRTIRVLHPNSFIEDPTRIFRAIRFAVRLGFHLDHRTREYAEFASNLVQRYRDLDIWTCQNSRLKQELRYILTSKNWAIALAQLNELGALQYLHPDLKLEPDRWQKIKQVQRVGAWLFHFARIYPEIDRLNIWQVRLELLISPYPDAVSVAERLRFDRAGLNRLANFYPDRDRLLAQINLDLRPSQISRLLERLNITEAIALAAIAPPDSRRLLYRYLNEWNLIEMPLGGSDLKQMGYPPGRQYQTILSALKAKILDREITTAVEAKAFVRLQFPLP